MFPQWVQTAVRRPHRCAVIPFIAVDHPDGFFDTGTEINGERVYVSAFAIKEMARQLRWRGPIECEQLEGKLAAGRLEHARLQQQIEMLERQLDAVDTLKSAGYQTARRPGRPRKEAVA